jgi:hypothetical protein
VVSRLLTFTILLVVFSLSALAQMPGNPPEQPVQSPSMQPNLQPPPPMGDDDNGVADMQAALEKRAEKQRIEQLKSDTDKLLQLSVELKAYVDKSNTDVLSLDVMRKAEEIEKLAKSVHDKMRGPN